MEGGDVVPLAEDMRSWVFEQLPDLLPDDANRYEVVDGNLVMTPPPGQLHQHVAMAIAFALRAAAPAGWLVQHEFPLPLGSDGRVPDVAVIRADAPLRDTSRRYPVGPEWFGLVVEVVSPRSAKTDRFLKPAEYAAAGIPCFWRVELEPQLEVHGYRIHEGQYVEASALPVPWGSIELDVASLLP